MIQLAVNWYWTWGWYYATGCGGDTCEGKYNRYHCDDVCDRISCGENEICQVHPINNTHSCECKSGYVRNCEQKCVKSEYNNKFLINQLII